VKLDAKSVAMLKRGSKSDVIYFDDQLHGFGYRIRAGAQELRSWIVQYRHAGSTRRLLLGPSNLLTAEMARAKAKQILAKVALGEDPSAAKSDRRGKDRLTLRSVTDQYLAAKAAETRTATQRQARRYLTGPYFRAIHGLPIDKVARRDIADRLVAISREHGGVTAARARAVISALFVWSMRMGITDANPVVGSIKAKDSKSRERVLDNNELARIWNACGDDVYGRIIRLLILTGCRRAEIGDMAWSEIDLDQATFTIPAARSKNHREHTLPLMPMMLEIIGAVPHMATTDSLFSLRAKGFGNWANHKRVLDVKSGVTDWTVHDIRRSVATRMADLGVQPHIIEQVLNHQSGHRRGVAGTYNRSSYDREVKAALATWADHIRTLTTGGERKVLPFTAQSS
jgi:integrase